MLRALLMCALRRGLDEDEGGEGKCSENNLIVAALGTLDVALLSHFEVHNSSFLDVNIESSPVDVSRRCWWSTVVGVLLVCLLLHVASCCFLLLLVPSCHFLPLLATVLVILMCIATPRCVCQRRWRNRQEHHNPTTAPTIPTLCWTMPSRSTVAGCRWTGVTSPHTPCTAPMTSRWARQ